MPRPSTTSLRPSSPGLSGLLLLLLSATAPAQQPAGSDHPEHSLEALSLQAAGLATGAEGTATGPIRLDGLLDERAWEEAPSASTFRQRNPDEGEPATETTEVRVVYGPEALYVGIRALDDDPDRVIARVLERDRIMQDSPFGGGLRFQGDDAVAVLFDPFHDHRNAMVFATNPNGAKFEALLTDQGQQANVEWRSVWEVEARRDARGWTAEFRIPFRTLRYPSGEAGVGGRTWGFNVYRAIRRKNELVLWTSWSRDTGGFSRVSRAGHLTGLRGLPRAGLNLEVQPYGLAGVTEELAAERASTSRLDVGASAKYEIRPGLVLDLTANPDFAQVEVDREEVNLTRFSLFFPEKRDFFLENSGIFEFGLQGFGPSPPPFLLFFSRRIGLDGGRTIPLLAGARLSGRLGDQTVGLLNVVTGEDHGVPRSNHGVARLKRDVGGDGYVGAMVTDLRRDVGPDPAGDAPPAHATAAGVDWSLWSGDRMNWRGFLAGTTTDGSGGDDLSYRLAGEYNSDFARLRAGHLFVGPETNAAMGFVRRRDIHRTEGFFMLKPRPDAMGLRVVNVGISGQHVADESWKALDWEFGPFVSPEWDSGEDVRLIYDRSFTRLEAPFPLADQVTVPPGDYDMWQVTVRLETSSNRPMWGTARFQYRRFFDGTLVSTGGDVNASVGRHLGLQARYRHNDVEGPWGAFDSDVASLRLRWAISTELSGNVRVQYNSLEERINTNVRVRLIHQPGSDLFLVYSEQRGPRPGESTASAGPAADPWPGGLLHSPGSLGPGLQEAADAGSLWDVRSRGAVVKLTYLLRI